MKFKFGFDVLLEERKRQQDAAQRVWADAQAKVDEAKAQLNEFYNQIDQSRARVNELERTGGAQAGGLVSISEFISGQNVRIDRHRLMMRELLSDAEAKRDVMIEAAKETKTLERLKEKRFEDFKLKVKKHELKEVDDMVIMRFKTPEEEKAG